MSEVILTEEQYTQVMQIAAEVGAHTALDRFEAERQREAKELMDSRLRYHCPADVRHRWAEKEVTIWDFE